MCHRCGWQEAVGVAEQILERDPGNQFADAQAEQIDTWQHVTDQQRTVLEELLEHAKAAD